MVSPSVVPYAVVESKKTLSNWVKWVLFVVILSFSVVLIYLPALIFGLFPWTFHDRTYGLLVYYTTCPYAALTEDFLVYVYGRFETWMYATFYVNVAFYLLYGLIAGGALWYRALRWVLGACIIFHFTLAFIAYVIRT